MQARDSSRSVLSSLTLRVAWGRQVALFREFFASIMSISLRREVLAEFLGTFVLMMMGLGVNAQVFLGNGDFGEFLSINIGWGVAVMLAVFVAGGVTGAHINPAVSLAMSVRGDLPWKSLGPYVLAQMAGAFVASALIFFVYHEALLAHWAAGNEGQFTIDSAGIWGTYPRELPNEQTLSSIPAGLIDQIVATALLLIVVCAVGDKRNMAPQANLGPLVVGSAVLMIGLSFGYNCGYAINPARDLGPRLFTASAGWGSQVFTFPDNIWWLVPVVGPCIGGVLGVICYDSFIRRRHPKDAPEHS